MRDFSANIKAIASTCGWKLSDNLTPFHSKTTAHKSTNDGNVTDELLAMESRLDIIGGR